MEISEKYWNDPIQRRQFLKLMGASLALAGISSCSPIPPEGIIPYVIAPEEIIPGKPLFYASSFVHAGFAQGILIETHMGRPTKIEGNPEHPMSLGATSLFMQANILSLYDPQRGKSVSHERLPSNWEALEKWMTLQQATWKTTLGKGVYILTGALTSPSFLAQMEELRSQFPKLQWHSHEPVSRDSIYLGTQMAFGKPLSPRYSLKACKIILSLGCDFLVDGPEALRLAKEFADGRRVHSQPEMNRLYVIESSPTLTGAMADHRLPRKSAHIQNLLGLLAQMLGLPLQGEFHAVISAEDHAWIKKVAEDLKRHPGVSLILPGNTQPAPVHALCQILNIHLGSQGKTLSFIQPPEISPLFTQNSFQSFISDLKLKKVKTLFFLDTNPVYTAPDHSAFQELLSQVPHKVSLGLFPDETAAACNWYLPAAHELESWGDARAADGSVSLIQPVIAPLYGGKTAPEILSLLLGRPGSSALGELKNYWNRRNSKMNWKQALHDGMIPETTFSPLWMPSPFSPSIQKRGIPETLQQAFQVKAISGLEIQFQEDPTLSDGRYAHNRWLQELPKAMTQLTWDNAALISPMTATQRHLKKEDVVELELLGKKIQAPVFILPGQADDCITLHLGYGREAPDHPHHRQGSNAYLLRPSESPHFAFGLTLKKLNKTYPLATTQDHWKMEGRSLVKQGNFTQFQKDPTSIVPLPKPRETLLQALGVDGSEAWAMVIDLNVCIGCKSCTLACQAENNIPIVGKEEVLRGRSMHWIRVDRYYQGDEQAPSILFQPVPCMHCENAPCELVCPTGATNHDTTGLNQMVYNRCVGTRYCSNNCPYKVRRFNFFQYSDFKSQSLQLIYNPDVTVRSRGVMEKCTYCVQRIRSAQIEAEKEMRPIRDGEVITACQAACPTQAIVFGNKNDLNSKVAHLRKDPLNYGLLDEDLNTQPRTTYLAKLRNPNLL